MNREQLERKMAIALELYKLSDETDQLQKDKLELYVKLYTNLDQCEELNQEKIVNN